MGTNFGQANVGFVSMGGARKFAYYATESSLSFFSKRRVKIWFLLDHDEGRDEQLKDFFLRVGSNGRVKILQRRELENYLISPRAIAEFVKMNKELSGSSAPSEAPPIGEVEAALNRFADELQQLTVAKRVSSIICTPVYPSLRQVLEADKGAEAQGKLCDALENMKLEIDDRLSKSSEIFDREQESIRDNWESNKLGIVQGDLLLDSVCQEFGVRFKKGVDVQGLHR